MTINTSTHSRSMAAPVLTLALLLACLAGCAQQQQQQQSARSSSAEAAAQAEVPAPTAEIADVTTIAYLGPEGTCTDEATKLFFGDNGVYGSQVDLLIDRRDHIVNLCEMKYATDDFAITKDVEESLRHKVSDFKMLAKTRSAVHVTLVTTYGVKGGQIRGHRSIGRDV